MATKKRPSAGVASGLLFGDVLRQLRRAAGLTQEELAELARLSPRGLSDLERGVNRYPRRDTVLALADALQLPDEDRARLFDAARRRSVSPAVATAVAPLMQSDAVAPVMQTSVSPALSPTQPLTSLRGAALDTALAETETPTAAPAQDAASAAGVRPVDHPHQPERADNAHDAVHVFLIADVRGYTRYTYERGDEHAARLAMRFAELARAAVEARGGQVLELRGDEVLAVFLSARAALRAAVELQQRLRTAHSAALDRPNPADGAIPCGIGLDAGEAIPVEGGYRGLALNLAARLCSLAGPGEVLASETVVGLARVVEGISYVDRGLAALKGFATRVRVIQVVPSSSLTPESPEESSSVHGEAGTAQQTVQQSAPAERSEPDLPALPHGGFLGAQPEHALVARNQELATLLAAMDAVHEGSGRLLVLVGEPGVGKTRLAQELTLAAHDRGFLVATGRCYAPQESVPYYPFLEALSRVYAAAPVSVRAQVPQRWPEVARLLPDQTIGVAVGSSGQASGGYDDQQRLFWHLTGFLQALAAERPLALLLDDLHWADQASIALLQHLVRHTREHRILYLGTYRDIEVAQLHPLARAVRDLGREHLVERLDVRRFPKQGTTALLTAMLGEGEISDAVAELVHGPTEGNAFFAQEVLRALVERGDVTRIDGRWERREGVELAVPENVRSIIVERVSRLSPPAQETLAAASVLGQTFSFDDLLSARLLAMQSSQSQASPASPADQDLAEREAAQEAQLEEAVSAMLLLEAGSDGYTFSHALTQRALYEQLSSRRRGRLHRAAGETIERLPEPARMRRVAEVAYHFAQADLPARALPYELQAAAQAEAVYANVEADRLYQAARQLALATDDKAHEAEALERLGLLHWWNTGDYGAAMTLLQQAVEIYRQAGNREGEARTAAQLARAYARCGRPSEGLALLMPLLAGPRQMPAKPERTSFQANLLTSLADVHLHGGSYRETLAAAERAAEIWRATSDVRALVDALNLHGIALRLLGHWEDALRELQEVITLAERTERAGALYVRAHAWYHIGYSYVQSGQFELAAAAITRGAKLGEQSGNASFIGSARFLLGLQAFYAGDWAAAHRWYDASASAFQGKPYIVRAYGPFGQGLYSAATGKVESGLELLREAAAVAAQAPFMFILHRAWRELAEVELIMGRAAQVRAWLEPVVYDPDKQGQNDITPLLPLLAWACIELGDVEQAEQLLDQAAPLAEAQHHNLALIDVLRVRALLAVTRRRWQEAETSLDHALVLCRAMPHPYAEAKALYGLGQLEAARGTTEQARERFLQAQAICVRLGEGLYLQHIERALVGAHVR
jgi:predicted ATPase/class 3 adenylate cyclase/transcriptional regulator with XRE-family HTH domain